MKSLFIQSESQTIGPGLIYIWDNHKILIPLHIVCSKSRLRGRSQVCSITESWRLLGNFNGRRKNNKVKEPSTPTSHLMQSIVHFALFGKSNCSKIVSSLHCNQSSIILCFYKILCWTFNSAKMWSGNWPKYISPSFMHSYIVCPSWCGCISSLHVVHMHKCMKRKYHDHSQCQAKQLHCTRREKHCNMHAPLSWWDGQCKWYASYCIIMLGPESRFRLFF